MQSLAPLPTRGLGHPAHMIRHAQLSDLHSGRGSLPLQDLQPGKRLHTDAHRAGFFPREVADSAASGEGATGSGSGSGSGAAGR